MQFVLNLTVRLFIDDFLSNVCLQSECLKEVFTDLDTSSEVLEMLISPEAPYFRLSTFGNSGSTQVCKQQNNFFIGERHDCFHMKFR